MMTFRCLCFLFLVFFSFSILAQSSSEDEMVTREESEDFGLNLVQNGNQNLADLVQFKNFNSQLSLIQKGALNEAQIFQFGSGAMKLTQEGRENYLKSTVYGVEMEVSIYQSGNDNEITQWSNGNNAVYQFMQIGHSNTIEQYNLGVDDHSLIIEQRGNDMNISVYTQ